MPELIYAQEWHCGLCPVESFLTFTSSSDLLAHARAVHEVVLPEPVRLKRRFTSSLDGAHRSAQNTYDWLLEDGRVLCTQVWSSGIYAGQHFGRKHGKDQG